RNSRLYGQVADTKRSLEQLIHSAGDGIISVDRDDLVVGWNPADERPLTLAAADAMGHPTTALLPREQYVAARAALSPESPVRVFEVSSRTDDGAGRHLVVTVS